MRVFEILSGFLEAAANYPLFIYDCEMSVRDRNTQEIISTISDKFKLECVWLKGEETDVGKAIVGFPVGEEITVNFLKESQYPDVIISKGNLLLAKRKMPSRVFPKESLTIVGTCTMSDAIKKASYP